MNRDSGELRMGMSHFARKERDSKEQAFYAGLTQSKKSDRDYENMRSENLRLRQQIEVM